MTQADKRMNLIHFGSNTADIQIQIQINLETQIWILDHQIWPWQSLHLLFILLFSVHVQNHLVQKINTDR